MCLLIFLQLSGLAINIHFTRKCNYGCKFCFHTEKSSHALEEKELKKMIELLYQNGAEKLNFAGRYLD